MKQQTLKPDVRVRLRHPKGKADRKARGTIRKSSFASWDPNAVLEEQFNVQWDDGTWRGWLFSEELEVV